MEHQEIEEILKELGLTKEEINVYIALLNKGSALASKISEETQINRSHVYQILKRLITKGFVSYGVRENRRYFAPVTPRKIIEIIKEREQKFMNILPNLLKLEKRETEKPDVEIFEGKEGIKTILNDIIRTKKEWLAFGSSGKGKEILSFFAEHWENEREKLRIPLRGILDSSESGKKRGSELSKLKRTEIRYVQEIYPSPSSTWIYGNRIAFIIWCKENSFAIRIISNEVAANFKRHFEVLWHYAKKSIPEATSFSRWSRRKNRAPTQKRARD